jgi:hypothetical protein
MVFEHKSRTEIFKIPSLKDEGVPNVWFGKLHGGSRLDKGTIAKEDQKEISSAAMMKRLQTQ